MLTAHFACKNTYSYIRLKKNENLLALLYYTVVLHCDILTMPQMKSVMCVTVAPMQQTKMTCAFNIAYTKEVAPYNYERVCMGET